jgi:WhiB family redox-sensing transcriptional regulator
MTQNVRENLPETGGTEVLPVESSESELLLGAPLTDEERKQWEVLTEQEREAFLGYVGKTCLSEDTESKASVAAPAQAQGVAQRRLERGEDWREFALCSRIDPEIYFPESGNAVRSIKKVCETMCEVREQCLQYALDNDVRHGIWGGLSARERRKLKKSTA